MSIGLIGLYLVYLEVNVQGKWTMENIEYLASSLFAPKLHPVFKERRLGSKIEELASTEEDKKWTEKLFRFVLAQLLWW